MATSFSNSPPNEEFAALPITCAYSATTSSKNVNAKEKKDGEMNSELWDQLPDALLDKIFARLTFHVLFQTRVLSKNWATRIARCRAFQDELSGPSSNWESYCPLFWSWGCEWLVGYNRLFNRWQKLFAVSYFPGSGKVRWLASGAAGSLLCFHQGGWSGGDLFLHVTNPLLKIWNKLPTTNTPSRPMLDIVHVVRVGSTDYKVIVVTQDDRTAVVDEMFPFNSPKSNLCAEIYTPGAHRWMIDAPGPFVSRDMRKVASTYFNGTLYFVLATSGLRSFKDLTIFAYVVGRGRWVTIAHPFEADDDVCQCGVVVCQSKVLLVLMQSRDRPVRGFNFKLGETVYGPAYIPKWSIQIFEIIPGSYEIILVCRGPAENFDNAEIVEGISSDEECVYLQAYGPGIIVVFDVQKQLWSRIPIDSGPLPSHSRPDISSRWFGPNFKWTNVTFQPGLNPFSMKPT